MDTLQMGRKIAFLRRENGLTQEELAGMLGISGQAVSKWESGQCCPDIGLLGPLSEKLGCTLEELLGAKRQSDLNAVCSDIRKIFEDGDGKAAFETALRIAAVLHEGAATRGYKDKTPWDPRQRRELEPEYWKWGFSARSEEEGCTARRGSTILFSLFREEGKPSIAEMNALGQLLRTISDPRSLRVLFAVHQLSRESFTTCHTAEEIAREAFLLVEDTKRILETLPVETKEEEGRTLYRLAGCAMHIPPLLRLLSPY